MAKKKELTEQEKVAEILKKSNIGFDPEKAQQLIALNTRCRRCGRTLNSLERLTFEDRCATCMTEETAEKRDKFVRKYIIIAFVFVVAIVMGGYCANSGNDVVRLIGIIGSSLLTGFSLGYVFYTNVNKMLPSLSPKYQIWVVTFLSLGIAFVIGLISYMTKLWVLYVVLMLGVAAYVAYVAYGELNGLKERSNLIDVYNRKSRDKEYVESVTAAMEARAKQEERERQLAEEAKAKEEAEAAAAEAAAAEVLPSETAETPDGLDNSPLETPAIDNNQPETPSAPAPTAPDEDDPGEFMI